MLYVPPRVLVVDKDLQVLKKLDVLLKTEGFIVDLALSAVQAIHLCSSHFYKVVIVECDLPDKNGLSLAQEIRSILGNETHLVFMSEKNSDYGFLRNCLKQVGGSRYFVKPFNVKELLNFLKSIEFPNRSRSSLIENLFTLPSPSKEDLIQFINKYPYFRGFELPMVLAQLAYLKVSINLQIYLEEEICLQLRFNKGEIVQFYNFGNQDFSNFKKLDSINNFINDQSYKVEVAKANLNSTNSNLSSNEIIMWAEKTTLSYLPTYWILNRLLPFVTCHIHFKNHSKKIEFAGDASSFRDKGSQTFLSSMEGDERMKNKYLGEIYNLLLSGNGWIDLNHKTYIGEKIEELLIWISKLVDKVPPHSILESYSAKHINAPEIIRMYIETFKELQSTCQNDSIKKWSDLILEKLKSYNGILVSVKTDYFMEYQKKKMEIQATLKYAHDDLLSCVEKSQPEKVLSLSNLIEDEVSPNELKILLIWAQICGSLDKMANSQLIAYKEKIELFDIENQYEYLRRYVLSLIAKEQGDKYSRRRLLVECVDLSTNKKFYNQELKMIGQINQKTNLRSWFLGYFQATR